MLTIDSCDGISSLISRIKPTQNSEDPLHLGLAHLVGGGALDDLVVDLLGGEEGEGVLELPEVLAGVRLVVEHEADVGDGVAAPGLAGDQHPVTQPHLEIR